MDFDEKTFSDIIPHYGECTLSVGTNPCTENDLKSLYDFVRVQLECLSKNLSKYAAALYALNFGACAKCSVMKSGDCCDWCENRCPEKHCTNVRFYVDLRDTIPKTGCAYFGDLIEPLEPRSFIAVFCWNNKRKFGIRIAEYIQFTDGNVAHRTTPASPYVFFLMDGLCFEDYGVRVRGDA